MSKALTFVEIDTEYCSLTYSQGACTASGTSPCFNVRCIHDDCQDPTNFSPEIKTYRYTIDSGHAPKDIEAIPNLLGAPMTPARLKPAKSIGERTTATLTFSNHRTGDSDADKYVSQRSYDPFKQGTYWGKFQARNSYIEGQPARIYKGSVGQSLEEMDVFHYFIDGIDPPDSKGVTSIRCADVFRFLDAKEAQVPEISNGTLAADIDETQATATLAPSGIGNAEYPSSGLISFGKEVCRFTRSGDSLTLVRAQEGTEPEEHSAEDTVQICFEVASKDAATIIHGLMVNDAAIPLSWVDLPTWQSEINTFNSSVLYSGVVAEPTPVKDIIDQFIVQVGLVLYPDIEDEKIVLQVLRQVSASATEITDDDALNGFKTKLKENQRVSQVWTSFNRKNVIESVDEAKSYHSHLASFTPENLYKKKAIKKVYGNWIPRGALSVATALNQRILSRYKNPPTEFSFQTHFTKKLKLGQGFNLVSRTSEMPDGSPLIVPCRVISAQRLTGINAYVAEEIRFDESLLPTKKTIVIDNDGLNLNLRSLYDSIYGTVSVSDEVEFIVVSGTVVGSIDTQLPGLTGGNWPAGLVPTLTNNGFIVGRGGIPGMNAPGGPGGDALSVSHPITIINMGVIGGAGGAGGGSSPMGPFGPIDLAGGMGAGHYGHSLLFGGEGTLAGSLFSSDGGDLGFPGDDCLAENGKLGGAAGRAVVGDSHVTWSELGDIRGARVG